MSYKIIAIAADDNLVKLLGLNDFNFSNHIIFELNNNLTKQLEPVYYFGVLSIKKNPLMLGSMFKMVPQQF